jgi:hypothetical protein
MGKVLAMAVVRRTIVASSKNMGIRTMGAVMWRQTPIQSREKLSVALQSGS